LTWQHALSVTTKNLDSTPDASHQPSPANTHPSTTHPTNRPSLIIITIITSAPNVLAASANARLHPPTHVKADFDLIARMHISFEMQGTTPKWHMKDIIRLCISDEFILFVPSP
jgi:hypothetical protein